MKIGLAGSLLLLSFCTAQPVSADQTITSFLETFLSLEKGAFKAPSDPSTDLTVDVPLGPFQALIQNTLALQKEKAERDPVLIENQRKKENILARAWNWLKATPAKTKHLFIHFSSSTIRAAQTHGIPLLLVAVIEFIDHNPFIWGPYCATEKSMLLYTGWSVGYLIWGMVHYNYTVDRPGFFENSRRFLKIFGSQIQFWFDVRKQLVPYYSQPLSRQTFRDVHEKHLAEPYKILAKSAHWNALREHLLTDRPISLAVSSWAEELQTIFNLPTDENGIDRKLTRIFYMHAGFHLLIEEFAEAATSLGYWTNLRLQKELGALSRALRLLRENLAVAAIASPKPENIEILVEDFQNQFRDVFAILQDFLTISKTSALGWRVPDLFSALHEKIKTFRAGLKNQKRNCAESLSAH